MRCKCLIGLTALSATLCPKYVVQSIFFFLKTMNRLIYNTLSCKRSSEMNSQPREASSSSKIVLIAQTGLLCRAWNISVGVSACLDERQRLPRRSSRMLMFKPKRWWRDRVLHKGHPPEQWRFVTAGGWCSPTLLCISTAQFSFWTRLGKKIQSFIPTPAPFPR